MIQDFTDSINANHAAEPQSGILAAVNHGTGRPGLIPLWTGEGHLPTPRFICDAAVSGLRNGETFYTWQRGIPQLRSALARYHTRHFSKQFSSENFFVTGSGMQAMQTVFQLLTKEGDEVVLPSPAWPNYPGPIRMKGAVPVCVPMRLNNSKWTLDLDRMFDAVTNRTKVMCINSPSNPLGWTATLSELTGIRDFCRHRGIWICADEVYSRFFYGGGSGGRAPSFLDICDSEEQVIYANTFSKNWAMTGWRVGWVQAPVSLGPFIEKIVQYNTSGTAAFMQRACVAALDEGEEFVQSQVSRARENRDLVCRKLAECKRIDFQVPQGAFYLFFSIDGMTDSLAATLQIIDQANVGFAPGGTFGPGGEGFLRMCYLRDPVLLDQAIDRFLSWLAK